MSYSISLYVSATIKGKFTSGCNSLSQSPNLLRREILVTRNRKPEVWRREECGVSDSLVRGTYPIFVKYKSRQILIIGDGWEGPAIKPLAEAVCAPFNPKLKALDQSYLHATEIRYMRSRIDCGISP